MSKPSPEESERDLDAWDAEIEAEFQRVTRQSKTAGRARRRPRFIGCPVGFAADVRQKTKNGTAFVVALCLYRRTKVCGSRTVTLPTDELTELGIDRRRKREALAKLQSVGLIEVETTATGRTAQVTLVWEVD